MKVVVIHEQDLSDGEESVIGVADSVENAEAVIDRYYGGHQTVVRHKDIRDSGLEFQQTLEVEDDMFGNYEVIITLEWFTLNRA